MSHKNILRTEALIRKLADGRFHSGESMAKLLGVSRTAVWKLIQKIESWQIEIYKVRGRGYKIPGGLDLINQSDLAANLAANNQLFKKVTVLTSIDSTSSFLSREWRKITSVGQVCIAEHQSAGRGRKGRVWVSPFAANLYFSIGVQLPIGLNALGGVSLAVGMALCKALNKMSGGKIKIKWPNDLLVDGKKLAGILVEASGDSSDSSFLNVGVGINWNMQLEQGKTIDQPWINLKDILVKPITRNKVLACVLNEIDKVLFDYQNNGFINIANDWAKLSACYQQPVNVHLPKTVVQGIEQGIESSGALIIKTASGLQAYHSGEVSLRKVSLSKQKGR